MVRTYKTAIFFLMSAACLLLGGCAAKEDSEVVLRISSWEEYIDEGGWEEGDEIVLPEQTIFAENSMVQDFETWYQETYGVKVRVEYSTFGTNEELYNQLIIGDVFDLVCPSEYMIMKMMREDMLVPFSDEFQDAGIEENYYVRGVSPYIRQVYDQLRIEDRPLSSCAAGYMWGTLGMVYNPAYISEEEAQHWNLLENAKYYKQVTVKDSVRDAYFAAAALYYYDEITTDSFVESSAYHEKLSEILNRTDAATVDGIEEILTAVKKNVYAFETDSGKADMVTGKVLANEQWSGDAVYTMDQAQEDGVELCYAAPLEGTNLWFDGWVMLQKGLAQDARKQHAAEAFINFVSKPENAVRNMNYIGYTSVIAGGDSDIIMDYITYNYGAEDDGEEATMVYPLGYFFAYGQPDADARYSVVAPVSQGKRQLYAQYPTQDVVDRSVVMACFDEESNVRINRMWTNVRCFDLKSLWK